MRRCGAGEPANHLEFGEAIAILAAFGLLNLGVPDARASLRSAARRAPLVAPVRRGRTDGLIGGQAADLLADRRRQISFEMLERIHRGKTGALFVAAATSGALTAGAGRGSDWRARRVRQEPRARVPDHRRPARRRRRPGRDRQGGPRRTRGRRRSCRSAASPARDSSPRELCETADRALAPFGRRADRLRELSAFVAARHV